MEPTQIALGHDQIALLDLSESRLRIFDPQWSVLAQFNVRILTGKENVGEVALGIDNFGNVYVSNLDGALRIFDPRGRLQCSLGQPGFAARQIGRPSGLWIDSANRIYIADTNNQRVQVFQLSQSGSQTVIATE